MRKPKFIFALIFAAALATACGGAANQDRAGRGNFANANSATNAANTARKRIGEIAARQFPANHRVFAQRRRENNGRR